MIQADIKDLSYRDIPKANVWAFGFPCQDLSVAGKQRGFLLKCDDCGQEFKVESIDQKNVVCPVCGASHYKAQSRSGMFFEIMRLLDETAINQPENLPDVLIAENVKGVKPYIPVLQEEYKIRGYTSYAQMFNSKYWGVPQSRERYYIVGVRDGINFSFPEEQHGQIPKISSILDVDVADKYYVSDNKARSIIDQALAKLNNTAVGGNLTLGYME